MHCSHRFLILFKGNGCLVMDLTCPKVVNVACDHTICNSFSLAFHIRGIHRHRTFYAVCTECNYMPCRCLFAKWYMQDGILQMPFCKERGGWFYRNHKQVVTSLYPPIRATEDGVKKLMYNFLPEVNCDLIKQNESELANTDFDI